MNTIGVYDEVRMGRITFEDAEAILAARYKGHRRRENRAILKCMATVAFLIASCAIVACLAGCLKDAKVAGHDQEASTEQGGPSGPVGGDAWTFNFSRTEQAAGGGAGLAALGWLYAGMGSRRHRKAMETVIGAIEEGDCKECKREVHRKCNRWLNRRVAKLTNGN